MPTTPTAFRNRIVRYAEVPPDQLLANPRNYRIHALVQQTALESILDRVGVVAPVVVQDGTDLVLDGHLRVALALRRGQPTIPVAYSDLSDSEAREVLATFDTIGELAGTDTRLLAELLDDIDTTGNRDLDAFFADLSERHDLDRDFGAPSLGLSDTGEPDEQEEEIDRGSSDGSLLSLVDVTIADPRHGVAKHDVWHLGHHVLLVASVAQDYALWSPYLSDGCLFCPYPGPFAPLTARAELTPLVLVQPNLYIAGHILDRWDDVKGDGSAIRA